MVHSKFELYPQREGLSCHLNGHRLVTERTVHFDIDHPLLIMMRDGYIKHLHGGDNITYAFVTMYNVSRNYGHDHRKSDVFQALFGCISDPEIIVRFGSEDPYSNSCGKGQGSTNKPCVFVEGFCDRCAYLPL
jgi:hypothetical protein